MALKTRQVDGIITLQQVSATAPEITQPVIQALQEASKAYGDESAVRSLLQGGTVVVSGSRPG